MGRDTSVVLVSKSKQAAEVLKGDSTCTAIAGVWLFSMFGVWPSGEAGKGSALSDFSFRYCKGGCPICRLFLRTLAKRISVCAVSLTDAVSQPNCNFCNSPWFFLKHKRSHFFPLKHSKGCLHSCSRKNTCFFFCPPKFSWKQNRTVKSLLLTFVEEEDYFPA